MRALKTLLIILLAVVVLGIILGLMGPKTTHVERSATIQAPASVVYSHVNSLKRTDEWSPWKDHDPGMKVTYEGEDGTVGSKSMWEGNDMVGKGQQEITALEPEKHVGIQLNFKEPFEAEARSDIRLEPLGDSTKVTWSYDGENNFISRIFCLFNDMDKMMGPDFQNGVAKLKGLAEESARNAVKNNFRGYTIQTVERPGTVYIGKREVVKWDKMEAFFAKNFPAAFKAAGEAKLEPAGAPSGIFFKWDEANKQADVMAGIPVKAAKDVKVKGWQTYAVDGGKALFVPYYGAYDKSMEPHMAIDEMMKANNISLRDNVIEEYITDPTTEPDTAKWLTNIYYMVN